MTRALVVAAFATLPCLLPAQRFEVASLRLNRRDACRGPWDFRVSRGAVNARNAPLHRIVSRAYGLTDDRVSGPAWIDSTCYDIRAKALAGTAEADLLPMLRTLLAERLHLAAERESAERPVFDLVADRGGPKIPAYGDGAAAPTVPDGAVLFMVRHMPDLCERLGTVTGRPVIDRTGLGGDYRIVLVYAPVLPVAGDAFEPSAEIFSAVREQLGLRLEPARAAVEVLRIRSVAKLPAEN